MICFSFGIQNFPNIPPNALEHRRQGYRAISSVARRTYNLTPKPPLLNTAPKTIAYLDNNIWFVTR